MSFHYGEREEYRNGRLFCDYTEKTICRVLDRQEDVEILDIWVTEDAGEREGNKWLNVLAKRSDAEKGGEEYE